MLVAVSAVKISACFDDSSDDAVWTHHAVRGASVSMRDVTPGRPNFKWEEEGAEESRKDTNFKK